jgi:hypothetical protein
LATADEFMRLAGCATAAMRGAMFMKRIAMVKEADKGQRRWSNETNLSGFF